MKQGLLEIDVNSSLTINNENSLIDTTQSPENFGEFSQAGLVVIEAPESDGALNLTKEEDGGGPGIVGGLVDG